MSRRQVMTLGATAVAALSICAGEIWAIALAALSEAAAARTALIIGFMLFPWSMKREIYPVLALLRYQIRRESRRRDGAQLPRVRLDEQHRHGQLGRKRRPLLRAEYI